jgi:hypothetical protein
MLIRKFVKKIKYHLIFGPNVYYKAAIAPVFLGLKMNIFVTATAIYTVPADVRTVHIYSFTTLHAH